MSISSIKEEKEKQFYARVAATKAMLVEACRKHGFEMTADERVSEAIAAKILGYAPGSLKNLRTLSSSPKFYRRCAGGDSAGGGRVSYRINDLAEWIELGREDW